MAEYDLGTAHGRIVIRSDTRGATDTAASMARLERSIAQLNRTMSGVERSLNGFTRSLGQMQVQARASEAEVRRVEAGITRVSNTSVGAVGRVRQLVTEITNLGAQAVHTGEQLDTVTSAIQRLGSVSGVLGGLASALSGTNDQMQNLPVWQRNILSVGRAISGYSAASRILGSFASRLGAIAAGTTAFGLLASRFNVVRNGVRAMLGTMAMVFPSLNAVGAGFQRLAGRMGLAGNNANLFSRSLVQTAKGLSQTLSGVLLMSSALSGLAKAAKIAAVGLTAITAAAGAMKGLGIIVLGLVNAVKQLSGAALIVPGVIAQFGIAAGVAKLGFGRLKIAMEAAGKTGAEFDEAIKPLSPTMQKVAKESQKFAARIKSLRDIASDQMFAGLNDDIRNLGETLLPFVEKGVAQVGRSLNSAKNAFRDFLAQPRTIRDLETAFALTGVAINNVSRGIQPFLNALRDIGIEGMKVFTELTGGIGIAAKSLENFVARARQTGQLQQWIRDGIQGFKDFVSVISDLGKTIGTIFRAFGADGENALARMRKGAENLNKTMEQSAKTGSLRTIAESLDRMSSAALVALVTAFQQLGRVMEKIAPFAERMSTSFSHGLVTAIQAVGAAASFLASVLSKLSGVGDIVGTMLALGVALKGLQLIMIPVIRTVQLMAGAMLALRGVTSVIGGLNGSMRALGSSATVAGLALRGLAAAGSSLLSFVGGPLGAAVLAVVGVLYSLKAASDATSKAHKQYATNAQHATEANGLLIESFEKAGGVVDSGVFEAIITNIRTLRQDLEDTAETSTGLWADLGAFFQDFRTQLGSTAGMDPDQFSKQNDAIDETARKAREAASALKDLGVTDAQIANAVAGTQGDWDAFVARLSALGDSGRQAAAALQPMRDSFIGVQESMKRIGPDSVQLSEAFQTLATASTTAAQKLDAIRSALTALGILESSSVEAAFRLTETIKQVGDAATGSLGPVNELGKALLNDAGGFNTANGSAKLLHDELKKLGDALIETAATGGDVNGAYNQMQGALDSLATQSNLSRKEIDALARSVGVAPEELNILVNLKGASESQAELRAVLVEASRFQGQTFSITAQAKTEEARNALTQLGFQVRLVNAQTGEVVVTGNTEDAKLKLAGILQAAQFLNQQKPQVAVGTNAPAVTQQFQNLQGTILGLPPGVTVPTQTPGLPEANQNMGLLNQLLLGLPPGVTVPVQAPGAPAVGAAVGGIQDTVNQLPPGVTLPVDAPGAQTASDTLGILFGQVANAPKDVIVPISTPGAAESSQAIGDLNNSVNNAKTAFEQFVAGVNAAMASISAAISGMVTNATSQLNGLGAVGQTAGASLGQGFADGIRSKVDAARQAALELAEAASQPLPRSPAEIGPFSGRGWTLYRGASLALGFSEGITKSIPEVRNDVLDFASAIATAMDSVRLAIGMPSTSFGSNRAPGPSGSRFYRDPTKTDADLAAARAEKEKTKADQAAAAERTKESEERKRTEKEARQETTSNSKATAKATDSVQDLAKQFNLTITSNKRNEPGSFHHTGEAFDLAGSPADMMRLNKFLAQTDPGARELFYDPGINIDEGKRIGAIGGHSDHVHYVPSVNNRSMIDSSGITVTEKIAETTERQLSTEEKMVEELEKSNSTLLEQVRIAQNPSSSDADVIRALQAIDDGIATTRDEELHDGLESVRDAVMEDRGIKKYDPFEGASTDPIRDMITLAQNVVGIFNIIKGGLDALTEVTGILARGISNTEDIHRLVDGFQGMLSTVSELASTIGSIVEVIGSLAALAGSAIPGIGQVGTVISAITGGIGNVNAIVDLIQEGFKIGGWVLGNILSALAGGAEGPLTGNVHVLLDRNDNTIKTWSDANPEDKRVHNLGPNNTTTNNNAPQNLNVYAGPGADPYQVIGEAMYAIRASNAGVYG